MRDTLIKAIAPWFGGKRTLAPAIAVELGKHTQFFEPFCGSMAVLFAKAPSQKETVNDLHGDLINLARCLQRREIAEELYDRLQRTLFSEDLLEQAKANLEHAIEEQEEHDADPAEWERRHRIFDPVKRAYWYFLASWMGRNGTAGTARVDYQLAVRWTKNGGSPTVRYRHAVESIPWWHERLRNVVILCRDAFKILDRFEDVKETAIYVDPPYHGSSRSGDPKNGRGGVYLHEFAHDDGLFGSDHRRLATILQAYKHARIVVSYYDCPEIRGLYDGWTFMDHSRHKHLHVQNAKGSQRQEAPEVLIINGPSYRSAA